MAKLLHIQSSPQGERSYSLRAAKAFVDAYRQAHPKDTVRTIDLNNCDLPAFDGLALQAKYTILHGLAHSNEEKKAWQAVEKTIAEFTSADKVVISAPMWNFGIPYRLKHYIDVIVQPSYTFSYSPEKGYTGLVTGRPALLILARGGEYVAGEPSADPDIQKAYLKLILGFIGFRKIDSLLIQPTLMGGKDTAEERLKRAMAEAREKAKMF